MIIFIYNYVFKLQIHVLYERFLFIIKALKPITTKPRNYLKDLHLFVIILLIIFYC